MSRRTSNWVDRGDPVEEPLARILASAIGIPPDDPRLRESLLVLRSQVEASATEGDLAAYAATLFPRFSQPLPDTAMLRLLGTALWHIVKAGQLRDRGTDRVP